MICGHAQEDVPSNVYKRPGRGSHLSGPGWLPRALQRRTDLCAHSMESVKNINPSAVVVKCKPGIIPFDILYGLLVNQDLDSPAFRTQHVRFPDSP